MSYIINVNRLNIIEEVTTLPHKSIGIFYLKFE